MRRFSSRAGYTSAGLVLVLVAALLGFSGQGLPALGMQMLNGEAWLVNTVNRSVSLIDGYSGKVSSQVGLPEVSGNLHVVNTPGGAVVVGQGGHMVQVSNDEFSTSGPVANPIPGPTAGPTSGQIVLVGGGSVTATAGQNALYAIDPASGKIRQLDPSSPQLAPIGPVISAGQSIATPVVAPDGSLYVAVPALGAVGHVTNGDFALIRGIGQPGDQLAVAMAGTRVVAADLSTGTVMPLGATGVGGPRVHVPDSSPPDQLAGSDISDGLVSLVGAHAVDSVDVTSSAAPSATLLSPAFSATASAMQGQNVVLINSTRQQVVIVDTTTHSVKWMTMPGKLPPDQITVRDRLVFVNASDGASALVINGAGVAKPVIKYTGPPPVHPKPLKFPTPGQTRTPVTVNQTPQPVSQTPHRPGAPAHPAASPGNASATVSWGAAPANGAPITQYVISWSGGQKTVSGSTLGTTINGLTNGTSYAFSVTAVNSVGQGPSASTPSVTPSSSVPDAPTNVTATAGQADGSVTLTWSAPDNGYHIASYTVSEAGTGAQMLTDVTGTTATIGPSQNLAVGNPVQFQVTAVGTSDLSSAPSAPSAAVTPYDAPSAPSVQVSSYGQSGTSAVLSVSCDTTCQGGLPAQTYQVTLTPSGPTVAPVTAAAGGAATAVTLTGLTPNTSYTASVTVTDTQNATGPANTVALITWGPPTVSNVQVSPGNGAAVNVTATVTDGGETTTCSVSVSGAGNASGSCTATISVNVPMYNTNYSVTFTATNAAGSVPANGSGKSGLKSLTADATDAFGTCSQYPKSKWCGANSGVEPSASFSNGGSLGPVNQGTVMTADCWTTGGVDYGNVPPYTSGSTTWIHVTNSPGPGYMSNLWFPSPGSVTAGLPSC